MTRKYYSFPVVNPQEFKTQMLNWVSQFNICCFLDNHQYDLPHHSIECIAGVGVVDVFEPTTDFIASLSAFTTNTKDWIFGHFNYDCKNYIEELNSNHPDRIGFPDAFLFVPEVVLQLSDDTLVIGVLEDDAEFIFQKIQQCKLPEISNVPITFTPRISHQDYHEAIQQLRKHIKRGDCYEINFCQEFYAENASPDFVSVYKCLQANSPNPFAAFYRVNDKYLACASPERYIKKEGNAIISQPIKGTSPRNLLNKDADEANKAMLQKTKKERSENVMIVDLVRNDLSKVCEEGTVKVDELMGVYSFPNVHQMISTVSGKLLPAVNFAEILKATFPMGSMTGAPKKRVMELIEKYEKSRRGIFSGTVGYIAPNKDFDFNVVIRSLMFNSSTMYLSYQVGGGITYESDPEKEYEECLLKAEAIRKVFSRQ